MKVMAEKQLDTVDAYIDRLPQHQHETLVRLRKFIHHVVPDVKETFGYNMPTFETTGFVCSIGAQKHHCALYLCSPSILDKYRRVLSGFNLGKGCIRFKQFADLPLGTLEQILLDAAAQPGGCAVKKPAGKQD
ncbi:MAG: DUF1801 domain-containing protein [Vampirovibrio sp.]|nr:DUF1801 domain-containing protein [Vampirovibrio sp.]